MQITWDYSPKTEALRLLHCAHQIAVGFYRLNGFITLPYPTPPTSNTVTFPKLNYLSIPRFWDRARRLNIHTYLFTAPESLISATENLLKSAHLPPPDFTLLKSLFTKHQTQIFSTIYRLMPRYRHQLQKITIMPTSFGTTCSFSSDSHSSQMYIWLRSDTSITNIVEAILSSLIRPDAEKTLASTWSESETIVDWLLTYSALHLLLKKLDPHWQNAVTIPSVRGKQDGRLKQLSDQFLSSLGAPKIGFDTIKNLDTTNFPPTQKQIFQLLLTKSPSVVTNDEISDLLYPDDPDKFSLYAIAKHIQRLRDHLESSGISGSFIQTKRGEGYLITN